MLANRVVQSKRSHKMYRGDLMEHQEKREPDMILHNGMTRIYGPQVTDEELAFRDEQLALGIIEFYEALHAEIERENKAIE